MGWWIFFVITCIITFLLVPKIEWKSQFFIGIIGMLTILFIDSSLVALKAFQFNTLGIKILGLPLPYWISYFPGAILFARFRPSAWIHRLLYILISAFVFMLIEFITILLGLFQHLNWNLLNSFFLNVGGFTVLLWFSEWIGSAMITVKHS